MNWTIAIIGGVVVVVLFALKRFGLVSANEARNRLQAGALVVDVRSPEEFQTRHLPGAMNLPLGEIRETIQRHVPDKNQTLLLHCLSGGRSEIAKRRLKGMGYPNVFNLGSYGRAQSIVTGNDAGKAGRSREG